MFTWLGLTLTINIFLIIKTEEFETTKNAIIYSIL